MDPPPKAAVRVEVWAVATPAAVAVKVAEVEPAGTVKDAGTDSELLLEVKLTAAPPDGARSVRMSVQVLVPAGARLAGTQASEFGTAETVVGGARLKTAFSEAVPRETVTVALLLELTAEALTPNVAEADPAATTTDDGTARFALLLAIARVIPPAGAAPLSVAVQLEAPGVVSDDGLHANEDRVGVVPTVTVPGIVLEEMDAPLGEAAKPFVTPILITPDETEGVRVTVATVPSAIAAVFMPDATHS